MMMVLRSIKTNYMRYERQKIYAVLTETIHSPDELIQRMKEINHHYAAQFTPEREEANRGKFRSLFKTLNTDLVGKDFLDLGPALGHSLEVAHSLGARCEFVEYEPYLAYYNTLKGFNGYVFDYVKENLEQLPQRYDFILSRGSINADIFNRNGYRVRFPDWLTGVESLSRGDIVICPAFEKGVDGKYECKDFEKFLASPVAQTMINRGYQIRVIPEFNEPRPGFPFTFRRHNE